MIHIDQLHKANGAGWNLGLRRTWDPDRLGAARAPLLIIPGYGMNSFIFGFHPRGTSMERFLAERGFEVWSVDLRGQGESICDGGSSRYGLAELILEDLAAAVEAVVDSTATASPVVDLIGCSLGTALMFGYVACAPGAPVGRLVNMGGMVRWERINPILRVAFASPRLVGMVPLRGIRKLAGLALPLLERVPRLLSIYIHPEIVDMSQAAELVRTVEDPNRHVNRDIAEWIKARDLIVRGTNVCERIPAMTNPLLSVIANADGIVPRECALWPHATIGSSRREILEVGSDEVPLAHADMFVSDYAPDLVFEPMANWLEKN